MFGIGREMDLGGECNGRPRERGDGGWNGRGRAQGKVGGRGWRWLDRAGDGMGWDEGGWNVGVVGWEQSRDQGDVTRTRE